MNKTASAILCGGFLLSAMYAAPVVPVAAQATKSANDGVYTAEQAKKGEAIYKEQCAACHGDNLEGAGPMPSRTGRPRRSAICSRKPTPACPRRRPARLPWSRRPKSPRISSA
jgi:cytochrome c5